MKMFCCMHNSSAEKLWYCSLHY